MTFPTHILAGLIIGKLTGDYTAALTGSLIMDVDHLFSYYQRGILFKPRAILHESLTAKDPTGSQKNIFHSVQSWFLVSLVLSSVNLNFGLVFSLAYIVHLMLDALNGDVYPFYPYKGIILKKIFIGYLSKKEGVFALCMALVFGSLFVI